MGMTQSHNRQGAGVPCPEPRYDAFISYGHAADGQLAPALQKGLQSFAKPWYRLRALRIFRDATGLSVAPELWNAIEAALARSRHFVLLASPGAAQSKWVAQEVRWWLTHRSVGHFLIVLTDGELVWDSAAGDFDWLKTNALPRELQKVFPKEPLHLDLRWAKSRSNLSLRRPDFADAVARLAATLRGISLDEIIGEEVRQHHATMRLVRGVGLAVLGMAAASILAAFLALQTKRMVTPLARDRESQAADQANQALSASLAASALDLAATDRELAILLASEAVRSQPTAASESALRQTLFEELKPVTSFSNGTNSSCYAIFHPDGTRLLTYGSETSHLRDTVSGQVRIEFRGHTNDVFEARFDRDGRRLGTSGYDGQLRIWETATGRVLAILPMERAATALLSPDATCVLRLEEGGGGTLWDAATHSMVAPIEFYSNQQFLHDRVPQASFSPDGSRLAVLTRGGIASIIDVRTGQVLHALSDHSKTVTSVAYHADGRWLVTSSEDGTLRRWRSDSGRCEGVMEYGAPLYHAAFSPDGRWIAALDDRRALIVWEAETGRRSARIEPKPQPEAPVIFNFSPNGKCVLTASYDADVAVLWETASGKRLANLTVTDRDGPIRTMAFSPEGKRVVIGALFGPARLYATEMCGSLEDLLALAGRRVSRQLTTEERQQYGRTPAQ